MRGRVLVTGGTGFVGRVLVEDLRRRGIPTVLAVRRQDQTGSPQIVVGEIDGTTDWSAALEGIDTVFHLAGRAHMVKDVPGAESDYFRINAEGTRNLAEASVNAGVRRLVFLSSIKVNGDDSGDAPFDESREPAPEDAYGRSKLEGENAVREISASSSLTTTIVRPPLVYGPGVKANFLSLMRAVHRGIPLPFGAVKNVRSLVYAGNLVDALIASSTSPKAEGKTFLVSDGEDLSTADLVRRIAEAFGRPARLVPVPAAILRIAGAATGKSAAVRKLLGSLAVDSSRIRGETDWRPPFSVQSGLKNTAEWYEDAKYR